MIIEIDVDSSSRYWDQLTQLEGVEYLFRFLWSDREGIWYLGVYDQDENPIALGIALVVNFPLLRRFRDARLPPGFLFCADLTGNGIDIQAPEDLGVRVPLFYVTSDDPSLA